MAKRILITGSREWRDEEQIYLAIFDWVKSLNEPQQDIVVVHGAARGADRMAQSITRRVWWLQEEAHPAEWATYGKAAGVIRNQDMIDLGADVLLAFIRNGSPGSTHALGAARKAGIPVVVYRDDDPIDSETPTA